MVTDFTIDNTRSTLVVMQGKIVEEKPTGIKFDGVST